MRTLKPLFLTLILLTTVLQLPLAIGDTPWLAGWGFRVMITIDADDMDTPLTHFPVLIKISDSSGINGTDVTFIFDEVEANSLRIAVTKSDGLTELYVEVEDWNNVTERAFLWVSKSDWTLSNLTDTIIYLYYDNEHADNTDQVGPVESIPGEAVWDSNFKMVLHLSESSEPFKDSTSNDNDASSLGDGVVTEDALIDGTVNLAGSNDYLRQETAGLGSGWEDITFESWVRFDNVGSDRTLGSAWGGAGGEDNYFMYYRTDQNNFRWMIQRSSDVSEAFYWGGIPSVDTWYHIAGTREMNDKTYAYKDGVEFIGVASNNEVLDTYSYKAFYGQYPGGGKSLDGDLDEVRLSNSRRPADWVEVTYETGRDHLLYFGAEEEKPLLERPAYLFGAGFNASSPWVSLYWKTNLTDITLFEVQNSTDKISWDYLGSNTTAEYHDFEVVNGTQRYYRVRACNLTDAVWDNSTWTDIDFETVYFLPTGPGIETEVNVTGTWVDYNFTSIVTVSGDNVTGFLNSTYFKDGDFYTVDEVTGAPGYDIRFNITGLPDNLICICLDLFMFYDGSGGHTFQIEVWNFTDSDWDFIEDIPDECCRWFNNTLECIPDDYVQNGTLMGRFYHPSPGNINHVWGIDYGKLRVYVPYEVECEEVPATLAMGRYYALAIILLILGILLGLGMRGKR